MMKVVGEDYILKTLLPRNPVAHKGDFGRLLIVAGSPGMAGAAVLCARGALRSGAGTVTVALEKELFPILQIAVPEAMCVGRYEETDFSAYSAVVLGPGLGREDRDEKVMRKLFHGYKGSLVIDADGLNNVGRFDLAEELRSSEAEIVITPHPGEAGRLLEVEGIEDRREAVRALAKKYNCIAILKGQGTLVTGDGEDVWKNPTGNPGMATGGSGDVLAGIVGALAAQGYPLVDAARIGVYVHGLAGDLCAESLGETGMTAGDLCDLLPRVFKRLTKNSGGNDGNQRTGKNGK